jgi:apurinic endonuclease APN1
MKEERLFGCHVSAAGGIERALLRGATLQVNCIQVHPSAPQRWNLIPYTVKENYFTNTSIKVFFHGIYLINLSSPKQEGVARSKLSLINDLNYQGALMRQGLDCGGVIFHVGSLKDEPDSSTGYHRAAFAIKDVLAESDPSTTLIMEVSAGAGKVVGSKIDELALIYQLAGSPPRLKYALDTQHLFASGYDLRNSLSEFLSMLEETFPLKHLAAIHLNDSKSTLGSNVDRHENLGAGQIGMDAIRQIVRAPQFLNIPFILETPCLKSEEEAALDVKKLRELIK